VELNKFFKSKEKKSESKVKGFKKEQGISINQFLVETTNVAPEMKDVYMKEIK